MKFFKEQHGSAEFYLAVFEIENPYGRYAAFYLEFARMFAEDVYTWRFDKNRMNTIHFVLQTRLLNVYAHAHG